MGIGMEMGIGDLQLLVIKIIHEELTHESFLLLSLPH